MTDPKRPAPILQTARYKTGSVRIIGGQWRGRKIAFQQQESGDLRPTGDRIRETLFNWLAPVLPGANCLDLFAGSGVLGLEAVSRGAVCAVLVERDRKIAQQLRQVVQTLKTDAITVIEANAMDWLAKTTVSFDVVFLDPPFAGEFLGQAVDLLLARHLLADGAFLYIEKPVSSAWLPPPQLLEHRSKRAGNVIYSLYQLKSFE